jgi:nucleotide-binding universal stress UspA family protein
MKASTELPIVPSGSPTQSFFTDPLRIRTILVAVDFSDESFRALNFALLLAKRFHSSVQLLYVYEGKPSFTSVGDKPELFLDPAVELFSEHEISGRLKDEVGRRFSIDLPLKDCHFRMGRPSPEICATAHKLNADLIVLATHGDTGLKHLTLGSTAEKVVRHANCPVLVVREAASGSPKSDAEGIVLRKILVPVDFSECATEGAKYASVFAARAGANLLLMHVVQPPDYFTTDALTENGDTSPLLAAARLEAEKNLNELVASFPHDGVPMETQVEVGFASEKLAEAMKRPDVDMVITSTHGYTGLRHALIGSTAEQLLRLARCPVLVVPSHNREMSNTDAHDPGL